jgi:S-formylglutathione hydrolase FrmB
MLPGLLLAATLAHGTVLRLEMPAPSLHVEKRDVRVYLPPSYNLPESSARRYPVLYLLHGWPGSEGNWPGSGRATETADRLISDGSIPEMIIVFPNGEGRGVFGRSLYINTFDGKSRMEDYIAQDLVQWTDSKFRTIASASSRAIAGLSDGGTGALNLTLRHPDLYGACGSESADMVIANQPGLGPVIGPDPGGQQLLDANSPALELPKMASRLKGVAIYLDCGTADESIEENRSFHKQLLKFGIPHTYREFPGTHNWGYWRTHLADLLSILGPRLRESAGGTTHTAG